MDTKIKLETRRKLFEVIQRYPGLHMRELARQTEMPVSNLKYHLDYLEKRELVSMATEGDLKRYYVADKKLGATAKRILGILRNEAFRGVIVFIMLNPEAGYSDIKKHFDLKPSKLSYYLKRLMDKGVIERITSGRQTRYKILEPDLVASVLVTYRPTFLDSLVETFAEKWEGRDGK